MKKILFINGYIYLPGESAIKRTFYLFDMMHEMGMDVTFLTSDFNHYTKTSRNIASFRKQFPEYKNIEFLHMIPYKKNISVKRYLAGQKFENDVLSWFEKNGKEYDVVYVSLPAVRIAKHIRKLCDKFGSKLIIDVNDLWPDSLRLILKNEMIYKLLTCVMRRNTNISYANADGIVAVSDEYLKLASDVNTRAVERISVYIGAMLEKFDKGIADFADRINKPDDEFWITYVGTLGGSYDIETVIKAVAQLNSQGYENIRFKILGHGPAEAELRACAEKLDSANIDFLGFLKYEEMAAYLSKSDACVNCIKKNASQSIINKAADYFASGNPVLNCGPCKEMQQLIERYNTGINYEAEDVESLCNAILQLYKGEEEVKAMGKNARLLAEHKFDRRVTHKQIVEMIERI